MITAPQTPRRREPRGFPIAVAACLCFTLANIIVVTPANAQPTTVIASTSQTNGFVVPVPSKSTVSRRSTLQLEVDTRWLNNYGYRPVRVSVKSLAPTKRDHVITIRLFVASWDFMSGSTAVEQDFEMPLGSTSAETVVACPQFQASQRYWWEVWVDGVKDEDLSVTESTGWQFNGNYGANQNPGQLKVLFPSVGPLSKPYQPISPAEDLLEGVGVPIAELPTRWLDYSCMDVVQLTQQDLLDCKQKNPQALEAILRWVRAGGQLWVSDLGQHWERLAEVERLLGIPAASQGPLIPEDTDADAENNGMSDREVRAHGWKPINLEPISIESRTVTFQNLINGETRTVTESDKIQELQVDPDWAVTKDNENSYIRSDSSSDKLPADSTEWYVQRPFGMGHVRVLRSAWDPAVVGLSWQMLRTPGPTTPLTASIRTTRNWESRYGMSPDTANSDFANMLVPGVGQAPVTEFRVLITLFVLVIGPLNYWLLKRTNRLHLLVLTVPAVALLLTTSLFAYALVSDGLRTKVRVRSFTTLDQRSGEAACWARLSYYASLAPGHGLEMPDDVTMYPIMPGWHEASRRSSIGATRAMEWSAGKGDLFQGWLASRTPTQYLAVRACKTPHRLQLKPAGERMSATNELGTPIRYVAVLDQHGNWFAGSDIDNGAAASLQSSTQPEVLRELRRMAAANEPAIPPELANEAASFVATPRRQRQIYRGQFALEMSNERLATNLLSDSVQAIVGRGTEPALELRPRSYVAITETGPEVVTGIPGAREEASFHMIVGTW